MLSPRNLGASQGSLAIEDWEIEMRRALCSLASAMCSVILFSGAAFAVSADQPTDRSKSESGPDYGRGGFYLWLGGSSGISLKIADELTRDLSIETSLPVTVSAPAAVGFNGRVGISERYLAAEVQFEYLPNFEVTAFVPFAFVPPVSMKYSMFTMTTNLKIQVPVNRFEPYVLVGGGGSRSQLENIDSFWGWTIRGGGGLNVYITRNVALSVDATYVWLGGQNIDLDYVSVGWGLMYKF